MKKAVLATIIIVLVLGAGIGVWGYFKAQQTKEQGKQLQELTADTMALKEINSSDFEIELISWENLAEKSSSILNELGKITAMPEALKNKINQFYSAKAQDKYKEAQYLQFLLDGQRKMGLKENQPKSKGQIETVLAEFDKMQKNLDQNKLTSGPEIDVALTKFHQEAPIFQASIMDIANNMNYSSPGVQLSSAGLDRSIDELKQAIIKSLNDHVNLQNDIKDDISGMANANWVNPLKK